MLVGNQTPTDIPAFWCSVCRHESIAHCDDCTSLFKGFPFFDDDDPEECFWCAGTGEDPDGTPCTECSGRGESE